MHNGNRPHIPDFDVEGAPVFVCVCVCVCVSVRTFVCVLRGPVVEGDLVWSVPEQKKWIKAAGHEKGRELWQSLDWGKKWTADDPILH